MFQEIKGKREKDRRWYDDKDIELILWFTENRITGFQICYDKEENEHALTWKEGPGFDHKKIDSGEDSPEANRTPILISDGMAPVDKILMKFEKSANGLEKNIANFIREKLSTFKGV